MIPQAGFRLQWGSWAFIVALTGRSWPNDLIRAANSGFDRHVGKPIPHLARDPAHRGSDQDPHGTSTAERWAMGARSTGE